MIINYCQHSYNIINTLIKESLMNSRFKGSFMVVVFAFLSMLCWGVTPLLVKVGLKDISPHVGLAIGSAVTTIILFGWMTADGGLSKLGQISSPALTFLIIEAIIASFLGDLCYFIAIKNGQVSTVATILSCSPLVTVILCAVFLNETLTITKMIGAVMVVVGIVFTLL